MIAQFSCFDLAHEVVDKISFDDFIEIVGHLYDGNIETLKREFISYSHYIKEKHEPEDPEIFETETELEKIERLAQQNPIKDWERNMDKLPSLAPLCITILSIPSSSAEVERSFSKHKMLITDKRLCLSEKRIKEIRFLQTNWRIFN